MAHHEISPQVPLRRSWVKLCPVSFCVFALLLLSGAATGQQPAAIPPNKIEIVPSTIEYVPPLAQSVLARNPGQVIRLLEAQANVDERVRGKDGARAGFTPLILAAALSDADIAQLLIGRGAKTTTLDDFHRSAFWYAALREDVKLTSILAEAPDAKEAVNWPAPGLDDAWLSESCLPLELHRA
jgi:hypothetical protein